MKRKTHILFISHVLNISGSPISLYSIVENLAKKNYKISLFSMYGGKREKDFRKLIKDVYVYENFPEKVNFFRRTRKYLDSFSRIIYFIKSRNPDLVVINSLNNLKAILACKILGIPFVIYVRELEDFVNQWSFP